jgi:hypothetical protein
MLCGLVVLDYLILKAIYSFEMAVAIYQLA